MIDDIKSKINLLFQTGPTISEDQVRSLMILVRKRLELMTDAERLNYLVLNLFCNWCAHTKIDQSNQGLRIIAKVNDALIQVKDLRDNNEVQLRLSEAFGYVSLRRELLLFLTTIGLSPYIEVSIKGNDIWGHFITHLLEIIRDVPLEFPSLSGLDKTKQKIYDQIAQNSIKPGAAVITMKITKVDYSKMGLKDMGELLSLCIGLEDTTTVVIPLLLNVNYI